MQKLKQLVRELGWYIVTVAGITIAVCHAADALFDVYQRFQ